MADIYSADNLILAKDKIMPGIVDFWHLEPGNTMGVAGTKQGGALIDQIMKELKAMGYTPTDSSMLISEVLQKVNEKGYTPPVSAAPKPAGVSARSDKNAF